MSSTDMPTATAPRRLTRSRDNRIIGGVCGGAARYFDIDPVIPRVVLAVLAVFGGAGIVIYAAGWLLIPEDGSPSTRVERWLEGRPGDRRRDLLIVVVALIALSFVINPSPFRQHFSGAAFIVIVVMAVAAFVRRRRTGRDVGTPTGADAMAPAVPYGPPPEPPPAAAATEVWPSAPPRRRERSWLGWLTLGATLLVAGGFSIVALAGWAHPQPADVLAACLAVLGAGVLVGAVFGRAWSMIPIGILLIGCLAVANALPRNLTWTAGNRTWTPVAAPTSPYVLGAGSARLDLTKLPAHQNVAVTGRVGTGRLIVTVPRGVVVDLHATASAGRILVFGNQQDGTGVDVDETIPTTARNPERVTLDLQMGFGDVEVRSAAA